MKKIWLIAVIATLALGSCTRNSGGEPPNRDEHTGSGGDGRPEAGKDSLYQTDSAHHRGNAPDSVIPPG